MGLTKQRYNLLKFAQGIKKEMDNVSFVCADVNCSLAIRFKNGTIKHFDSEYEFCSLSFTTSFYHCLIFFIIFWFFMVLRNFIFQIILIDVLLMATNLITDFYVNSEGSSYNFFFIDAG